MKTFRMSVDDCIVFLQELADGKYTAVFDQPFLRLLKTLHDKYGAGFCLNLFYDNSAAEGFPAKPAFDLSRFPDRFRDTFAANSDWLRFSFHAAREYPAYAYEHATYANAYADCAAVNREIVRFAGADSLSDEMTMHFGLISRDAFPALVDLGYRCFYGYLAVDEAGKACGSYYFDPEFLRRHPEDCFTDGGVAFRRTNILLNAFLHEADAAAAVREMLRTKADFYELMFHEQYFYPDYDGYIERYPQILETAVRLLCEHGYTGRCSSEAAPRQSTKA